ncbi:MAG: helix-turn-helix transcriptional regulator [Alphaproteobacteria bacterium]
MNDHAPNEISRHAPFGTLAPVRSRGSLGQLTARLRGSRFLTVGVLGVSMFASMFVLEVIDADEALTARYLLLEALDLAVLVGFASAIAALVLGRVSSQASEIGELRGDIEAAKAQGSAWRERMRRHMEDLAEAVLRQFRDWELTEAEQDIGFLLLKGFSLKEIANFRATHEGTVRQQAAAIYRKAGLEGRTALAAFFFEDLLAPPIKPDGDREAVNLRS